MECFDWLFRFILIYPLLWQLIRMCTTYQTVIRRCGVIFIVQFLLAWLALCLGARWFLYGSDFIFALLIWPVLERGSLDAIYSLAGIMGLSNVLFGWVFGERDKLTFGKSQLALIEHAYGTAYTVSMIVHGGITVLCLLLAKVGAREGALIAFITLLFGCVLHSVIFLQIIMNEPNRERIALDLWKGDGDSETSLTEMISHLGVHAVYCNRQYREILSEKIVKWILSLSTQIDEKETTASEADMSAAKCNELKTAIESVSLRIRTIIDKVPEAETTSFSNVLLKALSGAFRKIESQQPPGAQNPDIFAGIELFCCGYFRFLLETVRISADTEEIQLELHELIAQIDALSYYSQPQSEYYDYMIRYLRSLLSGLAWYLFLMQKTAVPLYIVPSPKNLWHFPAGFEILIASIFTSEEENERSDFSKIAWIQVCGSEY